MKIRLLYAAGGLLLLAAALFSAMAWTQLPNLDREAILARAETYDVTIKRDTWGVPHIFGKRDADVAFGLGYAQSEDDFENLALSLAMGRGELAKFQGVQGAQTDYLVHLFRNHDLVASRYETDLATETRALIEAYADGINLWGVENGEGNWRGILPATGEDVILGYVFRMPFFFGFERDLGKIFDPEGFEAVDEASEAHATLLTGSKLPIGSNAIALAPSRSAEGVTRLAVNSHQPYTGPVAWYEIVLQSEEGWHAAGGTFPGAPLVIHGHNENLGWANTVNLPDLVDIYEITVNPDNEDEYLIDGTRRAFDKSMAPLQVKLFGPFSWTVKRETLYTEYGPAIRLDHGTFAIRHAAMDEIRQVEQMYRLNRAGNLDEWMDAMRMQALPSTNSVYADGAGNIAYIYNARMPRRKSGFNWHGLLPGDTSDTLWEGFHPLEEIPRLVNPGSGFVFNANNHPFRATHPDDDLSRDAFPSYFGANEPMSNRALRGLLHFSVDDEITKEEFYRYRSDIAYHPKSSMMIGLKRLIEADITDADLVEALKILRRWDAKASKESTEASLAILTGLRIYNQESADLGTDKDILRSVMKDLKEHYDMLEVPWGTINRIKRGTVNLPLNGGPDTLRAVYGGDELDEDGTLTAAAGDTFIMMVEWDETGTVRSESIHQFGSATLDENSPHFADQVALFAGEKFKPVWFNEKDLEGHIERAYRPGQPEQPGE